MNRDPSPKKYDVFISYRHATGFYMAQVLYLRLIAEGFTVFMDKNLDSGKFEEKIRSAAVNCKNFIITLFPDDLPFLKDETSWLNKEAAWALEADGITIIPIKCDSFDWPKDETMLSPVMKEVKGNQDVVFHNDYSLDRDLDELCDTFLKNVSRLRSGTDTTAFFRENLAPREDLTPTAVDMAFHAGAPWLAPGEKRTLLTDALARGIPFRVLINTVKAAESIARHMRDENASYHSFRQVRRDWKKLVALYPDTLEVRACPIPLIHVHHAISFKNKTTAEPCGKMHIRYYAYHNFLMSNVYEHELNNHSRYYNVYKDEFEFLWGKSKKI